MDKEMEQMKKLLLGLLTVGVLATGAYKGGTQDMKFLQEQYGMRYQIEEASSTLFLIKYEEATFAVENNEVLGEVASVQDMADGTQYTFTDGTGYWVGKN